jgi:hypothetical protein
VTKAKKPAKPRPPKKSKLDQEFEATNALFDAKPIEELLAHLAEPTPPHPMGWRVNLPRLNALHALYRKPVDRAIGVRALELGPPEMLRFDRQVGKGHVHPDDEDRKDHAFALLRVAAHHAPDLVRPRFLELYRSHPFEAIRYEVAKLLCWIAPDADLGVEDPTRFKNRLAGVVPWTELLPVLERVLTRTNI